MGIITVIDISIAVILIGAVIVGYITGLVIKIAHLASLAVSYIVAGAVARFFPLQAVRSLIFPVVFLITLMILRQVISILKIVDYIPVAGTLNHIGGAIAGFLFNFVIIYIICSIFFGIMPQELLDTWGLTKSAIEGSLLLQAFC